MKNFEIKSLEFVNQFKHPYNDAAIPYMGLMCKECAMEDPTRKFSPKGLHPWNSQLVDTPQLAHVHCRFCLKVLIHDKVVLCV